MLCDVFSVEGRTTLCLKAGVGVVRNSSQGDLEHPNFLEACYKEHNVVTLK